MKRSVRRLLLLALSVGGLVTLAAVGWFWRGLSSAHAGWEGERVLVELPRGLDAEAMLTRLGESGVLRSPWTLRVWLQITGGAESLHAGEYVFDRPLSALDVLDRLKKGDVLLHAVTVPEGLVLDEIAAKFHEAGLAEGGELAALLADPSPIADLDPEARDLEGYLFPDTYHFPRGESPRGIVRAMVERFRAEIDQDYMEAAKRRSLTLREAVTLASLIEKETSVQEERGRISRVFHNRLARGMALQCDPTVIYALHREGRSVRSLRYRHLEIDSPWNTYKVRGLPPGPICNPGRASLDAAVNPDPGEDLYFVAAPGGGHRFSTDLASHNKAVREWRRHLRSRD